MTFIVYGNSVSNGGERNVSNLHILRRPFGDYLCERGANSDIVNGEHYVEATRLKHGETIEGTGFQLNQDDESSFLELGSAEVELWQLLWKLFSSNKEFLQKMSTTNENYRGLVGLNKRNWNLATETWSYEYFHRGQPVKFVLGVAATLYGTLHAVAWNFPFHTQAETQVWRLSALYSAASWITYPMMDYVSRLDDKIYITSIPRKYIVIVGRALLLVFTFAAIVARAFLVLESFIALPSSPASVYAVPRWAAYFPHIT